MKKLSGFTLIELLLVLVLIGIGSGLAIVSVDRLAGRVDERRWLDRTQQELRRLRNKAVLSGTPVRATVNFENASISTNSGILLKLPELYYIYPSGNSLPTNNSQSGKQLELVFFPDGSMKDAFFGIVTPSALREEFHMERITGRIERRNVAAPQ